MIVEHVTSGKKENVTDEQWSRMQKLFPKMFRKVPEPAEEKYSEEAMKIITSSEEE